MTSTRTAGGATPHGDAPASGVAPGRPAELLRSRAYVKLLVLAALLGIPIAAGAYFFLEFVHLLQTWIFTDLPKAAGYDAEPAWWPLPVLVVAGALVGPTIRYLPGRGGHSPADGFSTGHVAAAGALPGIGLAALVTLGLGAVLGPEAPLIALGGGVAVATLRLSRRPTAAQATPVVAAAGSTLLLGIDGITLMPLVIVAIVVAYVVSARITPVPAPTHAAEPTPAPAPLPSGQR